MRNMDKVRMVEFPQHGDERGHLVIVEGNQDIPFEIKRAFYIYGSEKGVVRGCHANRKSEFVLINVAGTSKVKVKDGKGNEAIYCLNRPHTGIYLPSMVCMTSVQIRYCSCWLVRIMIRMSTSGIMMHFVKKSMIWGIEL